MIVIATKAGQLGNRILLFAHCIANAVEYGYSVAYPGFDEYAPLFEATRQDFFCRYPSKSTRFQDSSRLRHAFYNLSRVAFKLAGFMPGNRNGKHLRLDAASQEMDLASPEFIALRQRHKLLTLSGWKYRDHRNFWKHHDAVCAFFTPLPRLLQPVEEFTRGLKKDGALLVGIHIRQGDYRIWSGGQYFFESGDYARIMDSVPNLFPNKKVRFLICSDSIQDEAVFSGFDYRRGPGSPIQDMYALAFCDYIIGPPSTFSGWASYYGKVPLYRVRVRKPEFTLASFGIYGMRP